MRKPSRHSDPLRAVLENLVVPVFEDLACEYEDGACSTIEIELEEGHWTVCSILKGEQLVCVTALPVDHERTLLRFELEAGVFLDHFGDRALFVGALLDGSPFHVRFRIQAAMRGKLIMGCDLVVRSDDQPLVFQRTLGLLSVGHDLEWYFPLRMPDRLRLLDMRYSEIPWSDFPHEDPAGFLEAGLKCPLMERPVVTLLRIAQGLGRWEDVLRLLNENLEQIPKREVAPLRVLAYRELEQWNHAIEAAEQGGLKCGRFEHDPWMSPAFLHVLIEAGRESEALQLLGNPEEEEPGFYDWFRSLAFKRFGYEEGAREAKERYRDKYPGDFVAWDLDEQKDEPPCET